MAEKTEAVAGDKKSTSPKEAVDKPEAEATVKPKKAERNITPGYMLVKVYSPYQVYFDNEAASISAINKTGPFDILPQHHKFLTLLIPCELLIVTAKGEEKIKISHGIMYVKEDRVTVFLDV